MKIRLLEERDIKRVIEIYSYYIENTTITFEYTVPSYDEFKKRFLNIQKQYPFIVYEENEKIYGYAYASTHHERAAYSWNCEFSIYIDKDFRGKGIGAILYKALEDIVREQGYYTAYALITIPNDRSFAFHKKQGFEIEGINKNTGFKFEKWLDVATLSKPLREYTKPSNFPLSINNIDSEKTNNILKKYSDNKKTDLF